MKKEKRKKQILEESKALIEMYQAGFLDAYKPKPKNDEDFKLLNKLYKLSFYKRFAKKINKELKKK